MVSAITAQQMKEVDRIAVEKYGLKHHRLMLMAGMQVAAVASKLLGTAEGKNVLTLAGKGNNGGDAIIASAHLARAGASCAILFPFNEGEGKPVITQQLSIVGESVKHFYLSQYAGKNVDDLFSNSDLIIDGMIGYSIAGNPKPEFAKLIEKANSCGKRILAIDVPSGLDATSGQPYEPCVQAFCTVTLGMPKTGLVKAASKRFTGELLLADIGIPPYVYKDIGIEAGDVFSGARIIRI